MSSRKAERSEVYPGSRSQSQSFLLLGPGSRPGTTKGIMFSSQFRDDRRNNVQFAVPGRQKDDVVGVKTKLLAFGIYDLLERHENRITGSYGQRWQQAKQ